VLAPRLALTRVPVLVILVPPGPGTVQAEESPPNGIEIIVDAGGIHSVTFIFEANFNLWQTTPLGPVVAQVYPAQLDVYIVSGHEPTVETLPGAMVSVLGIPSNENCVGSIDGYILCWKNPGDATNLYERTIGPQTDFVVSGQGCVVVRWTNGSDPTIIRHIPLVGAGTLLIRGSCP
jgi:hypothetical protein